MLHLGNPLLSLDELRERIHEPSGFSNPIGHRDTRSPA